MGINNVITIKEASNRWGVEERALRARCDRGIAFKHGIDCKKSCGTWLITISAMEREYGEEKLG